MSTEIETPEERLYLVTLALPVEAFDPVDAVQELLKRVAIEGLSHQTFRVFDDAEGEAFVVNENGEVFEDEDYEDDEVATLVTLLEEITSSIQQVNEEADDDEPTYVPGPPKRPTVDVELPEQPIERGTAVENPMIATPEPKAKKKASTKVKHGTCPRCKTEDVDLPKNGVCADCNEDIGGSK